MAPKKPNESLLQTTPNARAKQDYLQGWDFEGRSYKDKCDMFERMYIAEQVYEGGTPSKNTNRVETEHDIHCRKREGGGPTSPTKPDKGRANKCNIRKSEKCLRNTPKGTLRIGH